MTYEAMENERKLALEKVLNDDFYVMYPLVVAMETNTDTSEEEMYKFLEEGLFKDGSMLGYFRKNALALNADKNKFYITFDCDINTSMFYYLVKKVIEPFCADNNLEMSIITLTALADICITEEGRFGKPVTFEQIMDSRENAERGIRQYVAEKMLAE